MSNRRTSLRSRKQVDYSHSDKDFEDDDEDFASSVAPAAKRTKSESKGQVKDCKRREKENSSSCENKDAQCSARLPLDEKLFERDLQAALKLFEQSTEDDKDMKAAGSVAPLSAANNSTTNDVDDADDDDYDVDGDDDSDDIDDDFACSDSDDSEVKRDKKKVESKTGRGRGRAQKTDTNKATARIKRTGAKVSGRSPKKPVGMQSSANKGTCKSPSYSAAAASRPLSTASHVSSVMSPSSGLRLGLSRNVKVKPLHPSLHVTT